MTFEEVIEPNKLILGSIKKHGGVRVVANLAEVGLDEIVARRG